MENLLFTLLFTFLPLFFIVILKRVISNFIKENLNSRLPPGPRKLPIIGNLHQLSSLPHQTLRNLAKEHGPLMHLQLGEVSAIIVSSPKVAEQIMKTHDLSFADRGELLSAKILTYGYKDVAYAPYGDYWRQMKKIFTLELLSARRVQSFRSLREEEVSKLIKSIRLTGAGSQINLSKRIYSLTGDVVCQAAFGQKCEENDELLSLMNQVVNMASGFDIADIFPSLKFLHIISGMKPKLNHLFHKVDKILETIIRKHLEHRAEIKDHNMHEVKEDLLDVLLRVKEQGELDFPITNENIKAVMVEIFSAGTDTSSSTTEWAMSEMLKNPRVMEKAQAEVRRVMNTKGKVDESELPELNYLKLVIKETLRMHPSAPLLLPHLCRETCEIDGYEIPTGTKVIINAWAIARDPGQWDNPDTFEPERFDSISTDYKGTNFEYIPFGAGRRICPGMVFGIANVELLLAQLLYHFDWNLPIGVTSKDLDMTEQFGAVVKRKNDLYLTPVPYTISC